MLGLKLSEIEPPSPSDGCSDGMPGKAVSKHGSCLQGTSGCLARPMSHCCLPWPPACEVATIFGHFNFPLWGGVTMASVPCGCFHFAQRLDRGRDPSRTLFFFFQGHWWGLVAGI